MSRICSRANFTLVKLCAMLERSDFCCIGKSNFPIQQKRIIYNIEKNSNVIGRALEVFS